MEEDVKKFEELVVEKGGYFCGAMVIGTINYKNEQVFGQFCCIYQFHEDIDMEVLC